MLNITISYSFTISIGTRKPPGWTPMSFQILVQRSSRGLRWVTVHGFITNHCITAGRDDEELWMDIYVLIALMNTISYDMHAFLKYLYLKGTTNKHVDKCIPILMKLTREKGFEHLAKLKNLSLPLYKNVVYSWRKI